MFNESVPDIKALTVDRLLDVSFTAEMRSTQQNTVVLSTKYVSIGYCLGKIEYHFHTFLHDNRKLYHFLYTR